MADIENIYLRLDVDTKKFDSSLTGIKKEMAALKGLIGSNLISPQDNAALSARFGQLKDKMEDLRVSASAIATEDVFGNLARAGGLAAASISSIVGITSLLGVESKKVQEVEKQMLVLISLSSTLQQLADARRLKGLALEYGNRIKNILLFKTENVLLAQQAAGVETLTIAQAINTKGVGLATKAQLIWNAAMAANPIGLLVVAIAALVAGIIALIGWLKSSTKEIEEQNKAIATHQESIKSWNDSNEELIASNEALSNEIKVMNGEMTQSDADREKARQQYILNMNDLNKNYLEELKKINEDEVLNVDQKNKLIAELDKARMDKMLIMYEGLLLELEKIGEKEKQDNKKVQEQKTKDLQSELDKRQKAEEQHRIRILQGEVALLKTINQYRNEIEKETIAETLTKRTDEAFKNFQVKSRELFGQLQEDVRNLNFKDFAEQVAKGFENITDNLKTSKTETGLLEKAFESVGNTAGGSFDKIKEMFDPTLGFYNAANYKEFLDLLTQYRNDYYTELKLALIEAGKSEIQLANETRIQKIDIQKQEYFNSKQQLDNDLKNKVITQSQYDDLLTQLQKDNASKILIINEENKDALREIDKQYAQDAEALDKERLNKSIEYNKKAINDIIKINQYGIDQLNEKLMTVPPGSDAYKQMLEGRNALIKKQIEAREQLIELTKQEVSQSDLLDEEKLRETAILVEALREEIRLLQEQLGQEPNKTKLKDQISDLEALNIAVQTAADATNIYLEESMRRFGEYVDAETQKIDDYYSEQTAILDRELRNQAISQREYNKQKEKLDEEKARKEKKLKQEQWKKEKEANIIRAIINTAVGVTSALTQIPPASYVMAAITAALGAVEIALISSQKMPEFKKGGKVYQTGGMLNGASHSQGGIPILAEGGEFIIQKSVAQSPGMGTLLTSINNSQPGQTQPAVAATLDTEALRAIVSEMRNIPVTVTETDITRTQRKVSTIETNSTW